MKTKIIRIAAGALSIALILFFVLPVFSGIRNIGNIFAACFFAAVLLADIFWRAICRFWTKKSGKAVVITVLSLLAVCIAYAAVLSGLMISAASNYSAEADTIIVLGCKINADGAPSLMLENRLEAAYNYLCENEKAVVIVSGGKGVDEPRSEAEIMEEYLLSKGIDQSRIYTEDKSSSTDENIAYSLVVAKENGVSLEKIAIVTDAFHQFRAHQIAKAENIDVSAVSAETPWWLLPTYWIREWFGISEKLVFG